MLYMLLLYNRPGVPFPDDGMERHLSIFRETTGNGAYVTSEAIGDGTRGKVVRNSGRGLVTDGPFLETKEFLGGFYLLDCPDIDAAIAYAKRLPDPVVEVRPVMQVPGWPYADNRQRTAMDG
jgi:hypothetical protein